MFPKCPALIKIANLANSEIVGLVTGEGGSRHSVATRALQSIGTAIMADAAGVRNQIARCNRPWLLWESWGKVLHGRIKI
jgi:hypothetical protein